VDTNIEIKKTRIIGLRSTKNFQQIHQVNNNENISKEKAIQELNKKNFDNQKKTRH